LTSETNPTRGRNIPARRVNQQKNCCSSVSSSGKKTTGPEAFRQKNGFLGFAGDAPPFRHPRERARWWCARPKVVGAHCEKCQEKVSGGAPLIVGGGGGTMVKKKSLVPQTGGVLEDEPRIKLQCRNGPCS